MNFKRFEKRLPDTYQELEYIQSGSAYWYAGYIDTGLVGTDLYGCEIETCMKVTAITGANLYYLNGAYVSGQTTQIGLIREDTEYVHSVANMAFNSVPYSSSIALSDWHTICISDGIQKTDGVIVGNETYGTFNNLHYLLFARSDTGVTLSPPFAMKYFWIKKNGQYIRNMIPAKRKSDDVVGMYDIANDVFYTSENQYTFIGGNVVEPAWHDTPHYIHNTSTDTITTPAVIYPNDTAATVGLKGNTTQTGTPTPTNPIQPQETGDLSENLFDVSNPNIFNGYYNATTNSLLSTPNNAFIYIPLVQGRKYYVYGCKRSNTSAPIRWATTSLAPSYNIPCIRTGQFAQTDIFTITAEENEKYLAVFLCGDSDYSAYGTVENAIAANGANLVIDNGYKIPISSGGVTTNVYLGEVQTTRRIKKLVLDGTEEWQTYTSAPNTYRLSISNIQSIGNPAICSHFVNSPISEITSGKFTVGSTRIYIRYADIADLADFKAYLAQQYAAGTPVTVWYVLATETTGIVNEPLRKIGDYADEVSGITIPTTTGKDTFDVLTTLKPSEVELTYTGWHDAQCKEWDGSEWQ